MHLSPQRADYAAQFARALAMARLTRESLVAADAARALQPEDPATLDTLAVRFRTTRGRLLSLNPTLLPSDFSSGTVICIG